MAVMGRKKGSGRKKSSLGGGWEIIYTGFVLILLCFFIMLSSFATMEKSKIARFVKSFTNALSVLSGGLSFEPGKEIVPPSANLVDFRDELAEIFKELTRFKNTYGFNDDVSILFTEEGLEMKLSNKALFRVGSATLSPQILPLLKKIGQVISKTAYAVRVEGHTDNLPIHTKKFPSNWELSTLRAVNVLRFFVEKCHIPAQRVSAVGFGEYQPLFDNATAEQRVKNRRVEIILLKKD